MTREKLTMVLFLVMLIFNNLLSAQQKESEKISLLNYNKVKSHLNLDSKQQKTIEPSIQEIINIKGQEGKAIQGMRSKMQSTGMPNPSMREKMMKERSERQNKINGLIKQIEQSLNKEQLEKFDEIEKPNLMNKSKQMGK